MQRKAPGAEWSKLMRAAMSGDEAAYHTLLEDLSHVLRKVVRRGLGGVATPQNDVEDVVQDILLAIHLKRHTWDSSMPLGPWVKAITRNKMIDDLRRRRRRPEVPIDLCAVDFEDHSQPASTDAYDLGRVLEKLPERSQQIVRSMSVEGYTARDLAARLGMTEIAVRVVLHRSMRTLANACQSKAMLHDGGRS
ncbi:MAG: sigma-70 family RNA polymerase sigma factor [Proteobacteria bacterium]|nr:sigma-70 family RNA polymerase sigma factor [Pseudomonadota bacterium]